MLAGRSPRCGRRRRWPLAPAPSLPPPQVASTLRVMWRLLPRAADPVSVPLGSELLHHRRLELPARGRWCGLRACVQGLRRRLLPPCLALKPSILSLFATRLPLTPPALYVCLRLCSSGGCDAHRRPQARPHAAAAHRPAPGLLPREPVGAAHPQQSGACMHARVLAHESPALMPSVAATAVSQRHRQRMPALLLLPVGEPEERAARPDPADASMQGGVRRMCALAARSGR